MTSNTSVQGVHSSHISITSSLYRESLVKTNGLNDDIYVLLKKKTIVLGYPL